MHEIEQQKFPAELPGNIQQDFQCQQSLQAAAGAGDGPEHAGRGTIADDAIRHRVRP
jgi:hypothetical protein